jgi:hypothetical protein
MQRPDETRHRLLEWTASSALAEQLAAQIVLDQKFTDYQPSHPQGGPDGGKDALCKKGRKRWIVAVYFPLGQRRFSAIVKKFRGDFAGVAKNAAKGMVFVTNQKLTEGERAKLEALCGAVALEIYHLERIAMILDQPHMAPVRQQFLYLDAPTQTGLLLGVGWHSIELGALVNGCVQAVPVQQKIQTVAGEGIESFLTWQSRMPAKLVGRDAEMADLYGWATSEATAPRVRLLTGMGGIGKTRLAVEMGDRLREEGWGVCLVGSPMRPHAFANGERGNLLLIDYPELYPEALDNLLGWLKSGQWLPGRWRIVLLSRDDRLAQIVDQGAPGWRDASLALEPLPDEETAWQLFDAASSQMQQAMARERAARLSRERFGAWLEQDAHHHDPLIILAFALNLQYQSDAWLLGHAAILDSLVQHEISRMEKGLKQFGREQRRTLLLLKGLAALTGGLGLGELQALRAAQLPADGLEWPSLPAVKESVLWQDGEITEIQPDRVAAYFLHRVATDFIEGEENAWLWQCLLLCEPDDALLRARLGRLARLAWDYAWQNTVGYGLAERLRVDAALAERLELLFANNNALEVPLHKLVLQVDQLLLVFWGEEVAKGVAAAKPQLALRLNNWSVRLAEVGRRTEALAANELAVQIREDLARQNFAAYGTDLAMSLNNWSIRLAEAGQRTEALAAIERAVQIREDLARQNFAAYGPDLASSLNNWSNMLADAGQRTEALAASERAVQIREDLARQNFSAYGSALASSLNNWAVRLAEAGQPTAGLAASERAVQIDEDLARQNFAAYGPDLANSLNNWSNRLAVAGQRTEALAAIERAVQIREDLARQNFAAYGSDLAMSLNNWSVRLAAAGQRTEALAVIERAVQIRADLARHTPAMYEPELAGSLAILARLVPTLAAITHLQRALTLITPYALPGTTYEQWRQGIEQDLQTCQAETPPA